MNRVQLRTLAIVAALAVLIAGFALWRSLNAVGPADIADQFLLPGLEAHLGDVAAIEIVTAAGGGDQPIVARRKGDAWVLPDKDDYRAAPDHVAALLERLAGMRLTEKKTDDPARYAALGLATGDNAQQAPASLPREIKLFNAAGESLGDVIFGRPDLSMGRLGGGIYVRRAGEAQSWAAEGVITLPANPLALTDNTIFPVADPAGIVRATVTEKGATVLTVTRGKDGKTLTLSPAKGTPDQAKLLPLIATPASLTFDDMRRASSDKPLRSVIFQAADGTKYTLALFPHDKEMWVGASEAGSPTAEAFNAAHQGYRFHLPDYRAAILMNAPADFTATKPAAKP